MRVEAALWRGRPVYLDVAAVPIEAEPVPHQTVTRGSSAARIIIILIFVSSVASLLFFPVPRGVEEGRHSRRCTTRDSGVLRRNHCVGSGNSHVPTFRELYLIIVGLGRAFYSGALTGLCISLSSRS